ncbi:MAG TPA: hypothetical protein VFQ53_33210 [Kofleriaceae bacterium]|nr:hypothetical protein [Kofleriaceae bacterium]
METKAIASELWHVIGDDLRMPGGFYMPSRAIAIRLPDRTLAIYSPIAIDDAMAAALAGLGEIAHLIVPSRLHCQFAAEAAERWPRAIVHAAPGVADKVPGLRIDRDLVADPEPAWRDVLALERIGGAPKANEVVVLHRPTGTLICADLLFHVTEPANLRTRVVLALMGTGGRKLAQSRAWSMLRKDKAAARASVERILAWPIARVAPCHGDAIEIDAAGLAPLMRRLCGQIPTPSTASRRPEAASDLG